MANTILIKEAPLSLQLKVRRDKAILGVMGKFQTRGNGKRFKNVSQ